MLRTHALINKLVVVAIALVAILCVCILLRWENIKLVMHYRANRVNPVPNSMFEMVSFSTLSPREAELVGELSVEHPVQLDGANSLTVCHLERQSDNLPMIFFSAYTVDSDDLTVLSSSREMKEIRHALGTRTSLPNARNVSLGQLDGVWILQVTFDWRTEYHVWSESSNDYLFGFAGGNVIEDNSCARIIWNYYLKTAPTESHTQELEK